MLPDKITLNLHLFLAWYSFGFITFLVLFKAKHREVIVSDLLLAVVYSFGGPLSSIIALLELADDDRFDSLRKFLNKKIF